MVTVVPPATGTVIGSLRSECRSTRHRAHRKSSNGTQQQPPTPAARTRRPGTKHTGKTHLSSLLLRYSRGSNHTGTTHTERTASGENTSKRNHCPLLTRHPATTFNGRYASILRMGIALSPSPVSHTTPPTHAHEPAPGHLQHPAALTALTRSANGAAGGRCNGAILQVQRAAFALVAVFVGGVSCRA